MKWNVEFLLFNRDLRLNLPDIRVHWNLQKQREKCKNRNCLCNVNTLPSCFLIKSEAEVRTRFWCWNLVEILLRSSFFGEDNWPLGRLVFLQFFHTYICMKEFTWNVRQGWNICQLAYAMSTRDIQHGMVAQLPPCIFEVCIIFHFSQPILNHDMHS